MERACSYFVFVSMVGWFLYRGIVQLVERRSPKPDVVGSSPTAPVIKVDFTGFLSGISLFLLCGFWKDTVVVIMYLSLF